VVIDAAIGAHGRGSRPVHYLTVAATLDKSLSRPIFGYFQGFGI